jgi:hypothetical protein
MWGFFISQNDVFTIYLYDMRIISYIKVLVFSCSLFTIHYSSAQVWNSLGSGLNTGAEGLEMLVYKDTLYITGGMTAGGLDAGGLAKWDGTQWDTLEHYQYEGVGGNPLAIFRDSLAMANRLDYKSTAGYLADIAISDGYVVKPLCNNCKKTSGSIKSMIEYKGELYVGGNFVNIGGLSVNRIARYDGTSWNTVGGGVTSGGSPEVTAMAIYDGEFYVAGDIRKVGTVDVKNVARWDGTTWRPVGTGLGSEGIAVSMTVDTINNFLYVGGGFSTAGDGKYVRGTAVWDGEVWDSVGTPITGARAMTMYKNQLYVCRGGGPTWTAADTVMARWDGKYWYPVHGPNGGVMSLATYKDELYVGGAFTKINDDDIHGIARYKDTTTIKNCNYLQPRIFISYNDVADSSRVQFKNNNKYASSWEWDFDDGNQAFEQNPEHKYTDVGTYNVTVTVTHDGCTVSYSREVVVDSVVLGVNQQSTINNQQLKVYPNPAKDEITISLNSKTLVNPKIEIYSLEGKKVKEIYEFGSEVKISLTDFSKGVYLVKLFDNGKELSSEKIVIE